MRILIDINHPAHVHYFRNFIKLMEAKGHRFCVINRDSKMINQLLDFYQIEHTVRNKRPEKKGTMASLMNLARMTCWCIRKSISFRPDMYVGFASSACAITGWLFRKPSILMDDTEHNAMNHRIYMPVCSVVLTPFYFNINLQTEGVKNVKQIRFNAFVEQLYLHNTYYKKNESVLKALNVKPKEYVVVRYIAYDAHHDLVARPLSEDAKKRIVSEIAKRYKVFVSLESGIYDQFYTDYQLKISPEQMHDVLANAKFMVTEGATMASEAFVLGVPYIYLNPLKCGNIDYQCENYPRRAFQTTDANEALGIVERLLRTEIDSEAEQKGVESQTINPTEFLEWFVEHFPDSKHSDYPEKDYANICLD